MDRAERMTDLLQSEFQPVRLEIENESSRHGVDRGGESHFKLLLVSEKFRGRSRVERQQSVANLLKSEMDQGLHALTMRVLTPEEWEAGQADGFISPDCAHKRT